MTTGHGHGHGGAAPPVRVGARPRAVLLVLLALAAVATIVGLVVQWPDGGALDDIQATSQYAAPGVTFPDATVTRVLPACPPGGDGSGTAPTCGALEVRVDQGPGTGDMTSVRVGLEVTRSSLAAGDAVQLVRNPAADGEPASYSYLTTRRSFPLALLALVFVLLVLVVARLRGLMALVSLGVGGLAIWRFTLPALLTGGSGTWIALTTASAIMFGVLYATHGVSLRTSAALAGTLAGVGATAVLGLVVIDGARLTGVADETGGYLTAAAGSLDFRGLLSCGIVIAGLGVLNDVTVTQASAVWELRAASPGMTRHSVFASAMRIGRDHIASTIYTVVFAYAGTALVTLLLLLVYDRPLLELLSTEELAEEVARTLTSGIGLVLAVPLTTAIAALVAGPGGGDGRPAPAPGRRRAPRRRRWARSPDWDLEADGDE